MASTARKFGTDLRNLNPHKSSSSDGKISSSSTTKKKRSSSLHPKKSKDTEKNEGRKPMKKSDYTVHFTAGPLGLQLEPVVRSVMGRDLGCRVVDFVDEVCLPVMKTSQARLAGVISVGDVIIAVDDTPVLSKMYVDIVDLLKSSSEKGGRTIAFRNMKDGDKSKVKQGKKSDNNFLLRSPPSLQEKNFHQNQDEDTSFTSILSISPTASTTQKGDAIEIGVFSPSNVKRQVKKKNNQSHNKKTNEVVADKAVLDAKHLVQALKVIAPIAESAGSFATQMACVASKHASRKGGEFLIGHSENDYKNAIRQKHELLTELSYAKTELGKEKEQFQSLQSINTDMEVKLNLLKHDLDASKGYVCKLEAKVRDQEIVKDQLLVENKSISNDTKVAKKEISRLATESQRSNEMIKIKDEQIMSLEKNVQDLSEKFSALGEKHSSVIFREENLRNQNEDLQDRLTNVNEQLQLTSRHLSESNAESKMMKEERDGMKLNISDLKATLVTEIEGKESALSAVFELKKSLSVSESKLNIVQARNVENCSNFKISMKDYEQKRDQEVNETLCKYESLKNTNAKEIDALKKNICNLQEKITVAIDRVNDSEAQLVQARADLESRNKESVDYINTIKQLETKIQYNQNELRSLKTKSSNELDTQKKIICKIQEDVAVATERANDSEAQAAQARADLESRERESLHYINMIKQLETKIQHNQGELKSLKTKSANEVDSQRNIIFNLQGKVAAATEQANDSEAQLAQVRADLESREKESVHYIITIKQLEAIIKNNQDELGSLKINSAEEIDAQSKIIRNLEEKVSDITSRRNELETELIQVRTDLESREKESRHSINTIKQLEATIQHNEDEFKCRNEELESRITSIKEDLAETIADREDKTNQLRVFHEKLEAMTICNSELRKEVKKTKEAAKEEIDIIASELHELSSALAPKMDTLQKDNDRLSAKVISLQETSNTKDMRIDAMKKEVSLCKEALTEAIVNDESFVRKHQAMKAELELMEERVYDALDLVDEREGTNQVLTNEIEALNEELQEKEKEINELREATDLKVTSLEQNIVSLHDDFKSNGMKLCNAQTRENELRDKLSLVLNEKHCLEGCLEDEKNLKAQLDCCYEEISTLKGKIAEQSSEIKTIQTRENELRDKLSLVSDEKHCLEMCLVEEKNLKAQLDCCYKEISMLKGRITDQSSEIKTIQTSSQLLEAENLKLQSNAVKVNNVGAGDDEDSHTCTPDTELTRQLCQARNKLLELKSELKASGFLPTTKGEERANV